jgi:hypothetical protein
MKKLPIRPGSHVKDTDGYKRLLNFFRSEWVIRPITPDYGIDYEIEPWKNGRPVNKVLKVQVKNNDEVHEDFTPIHVYQIKVSTINYLDSFENTFFLMLTQNDVFSFNVRAITQVFNINEKVDNSSIPFVYKRKFLSTQYYLWTENSKHRIVFNLLGAELSLDELESEFKDRTEFENYYLTNVKNQEEKDFYLREEWANFGFYYSTLRRGKAKAIEKLLRNLQGARPLVKRGIIEGLAHLSYKNTETEKIAESFIESNNSQDILVGLMHLSAPGDNSHLDTYLKAIYGYFNNRRCILEDEETHGVELISIEALFRISTRESLLLIVEIYFNQSFKPTEIKYIHSLFVDCESNKKNMILSLVNEHLKKDYTIADYDNILNNHLEIYLNNR